MGETDPILVANPDAGNPHISITFEEKDLSIGTARYRGAKQVSKNLAMRPNVPGVPDSPIAHANVEVHLYDDHGHEVPMTRRLVRSWYIDPLPNAKVSDLGRWRIVGLNPSDVGTPLPVAPGQPTYYNFQKDGPGAEDAPGLTGLSVKDEPYGQLQEFLAGNERVGGVYYQVYTLEDKVNTRVFSSAPEKLSAKEYREALQLIDSGEYSQTMARKLFFMPKAGGKDETTPYPRQGR
jgi:hypothetical protein